MRVFLIADLQRKVGFGEGGDGVLVRVVGDELVSRPVTKAHAQFALAAIHDRGLGGGDDERRSWIAQVGEEDVLPQGRPDGTAHVLYVQHVVLEIFIEDARLNLERSL